MKVEKRKAVIDKLFDKMLEDATSKLEELLQIAIGALADLSTNKDLTRKQMQHKAQRIYDEIQKEREESK